MQPIYTYAPASEHQYPGHPEHPERLNLLEFASIPGIQPLSFSAASRLEVERVHTPDMLSNAEKITYLKVALPMVWLGSSICPSNHQKQYAWYLYNHQRPFVQFGRWFR